jgi:1,4-dihydroxy-6-naphthoate synthase
MSKRLILGFSSCPNDTFMFDALVNGKLNTGNFRFEPFIADIEELNRAVMQSHPDISKISIAAYPSISDKYQLLRSGSAVGYKNGPLLVSKRKIYPDELSEVNVAIPGFHTTANLLLSILFPEIKTKRDYLFSDIEDVVLSDEVDAGLLIHEGRFTYQAKGLKLVADLGERWEDVYDSPVPLGGIAVRRDLPEKDKLRIEDLIRQSIQFAFAYPDSSRLYVKQHSKELADEVILQHIELYVNDFSTELGKAGEKAITSLYEKGSELKLLELKDKSIFV